MRKLVSICLCLILVLAPVGVFAVEHNNDLMVSYIYHSTGGRGMRTPLRAPAAYVVLQVINYTHLGLESSITPVEVATFGTRTYIVCNSNHAIYVLDNDFRLERIIYYVAGLDNPTFASPEGVFVTDYDAIYIADTLNNRIVKVDGEGNLIQEFTDPGIMVMGERVPFLPSKIAVDHAGRMYVVGRHVNRGIIELLPSGEFRAFVGAPRVRMDATEVLRRFFMTQDQLDRMARFVPTEYNNLTVDSQGFVFGTIGAVDPGEIFAASRYYADGTPDRGKPVKRLSPAGNDVMRRRGNVPIIGALSFMHGHHSYVVDVDVRPDGVFAIVDQRNSKVFGYDMYGNMLFVFGNQGTQAGSFHSPSSISFKDDLIIVTDQVLGTISIFEPTTYGATLLRAVNLDYHGRFEEASELWHTLLRLNSNLQLAYSGIGRMHYRNGDFTTAMEYFRVAFDSHNYDLARERLRRQLIGQYFPIVFAGVMVLTAGLIVHGSIMKARRRKTEEGGGDIA